eukprot:scaffold6.g2751.t1
MSETAVVRLERSAAAEAAVLGRPLRSAAAWTAADALAHPAQWQYALTPEDVAELVAATRAALASGKPVPQELTKAEFALSTLGPRLEAMRDSVVFGRGFYLLRGFPVGQLSRQEVVAAWYGVGLYWGLARSQNAKGHVVGHIKDLGLDANANDVRPWHTDDADLVGLLCLKQAKQGGLSGWASAVSIYNRLAETRPDLVEELSKVYAFDKKGEVAPGTKPYLELPVLSRFPEVSRLTPKQLEALQAVTALASSPELHLEWDLQARGAGWQPGPAAPRPMERAGGAGAEAHAGARAPALFPPEAYLGIPPGERGCKSSCNSTVECVSEQTTVWVWVVRLPGKGTTGSAAGHDRGSAGHDMREGVFKRGGPGGPEQRVHMSGKALPEGYPKGLQVSIQKAPIFKPAKAAAARPVAVRALTCSAQQQDAVKQLGSAAAACALAVAFTFTGVEAAKADVAGLTPCAESKAFAKRKANEVKALQKRLTQYEADSAPAVALNATIAKTERRFDKYASQGLLCGADGLPHLIADPGLAIRYGHAGDVFLPTLGFVYFAGWLGFSGSKYLQAAKEGSKPTEKEIIIDVPFAFSLLWQGLAWPVLALAEYKTGRLFEDNDKITVSPR